MKQKHVLAQKRETPTFRSDSVSGTQKSTAFLVHNENPMDFRDVLEAFCFLGQKDRSLSCILKIRSADFHDMRGKRGFRCGKCGYNAHELAALSHCPLCLICDGCNKTVRKCRCKEGE